MNAIEVWLTIPLVERLGWTLLHFVWQGALIAALAAVALAVMRRCSANARYLVCAMALMLSALAPVATFFALTIHGSGTPAEVVAGRLTTRIAERPPATLEVYPAGGDVVRNGEPATVVYAAAGEPAAMSVRAERVSMAEVSASGAPAGRREALERWLPWLVAGWIAGVMVLSVRLLGGLWRIRAVTRKGARPAAEQWQSRAREVAGRLGLRRAVQLLETTRYVVPITIGWLRPVVLLPASAVTGLRPEQVEALLAHELAHFRRHDYLVNLAQTVVETFLFYHPAVWWLSHRIRVEREYACDDLAARACGDAVLMARALTDMEGLCARLPRVAMAATGGSLLDRVGRLIGRPASTRPTAPTWLAGPLVLALLAGLTGIGHQQGHAYVAEVYRLIEEEDQLTNDVTGRVIDERGQPVPGVTVLAVQDPEDKDLHRTARTDADGLFMFPDLAEGYWSFSVDDAGYGWMWKEERSMKVPAMPERLPVTITLYDPRTMAGVVVDASGQPISGVRVAFINGRVAGAEELIYGHLHRDLQVVLTDEDGRFGLSRLRPGEVDLALEHPEFAHTLVDSVAVDGEEKRLTIERGLALRGRVVREGVPVAGVDLRAGLSNACRPVIRWRGTSDERGEFEIPRIPPVPPKGYGKWTSVSVWVDDPVWNGPSYSAYQTQKGELPFLEIEAWRKEDHEPRVRRPRVEVGKRPGYLGDGPPPENPGTIRVSVVPPEEGWIFFDPAGSDGGRLRELRDAVRGRVEFESVPPGEYTISFRSWSAEGIARTPLTVEIGEGQTVEVALEPAESRIDGVVRSSSNPVERGIISWTSIFDREGPPLTPASRESLLQGSSPVGPGGGYRIEGLPARLYEIGYVDETRSMSHRFIVDHAGPETTFDIELPSARIEGRLVGIEPKPPLENVEDAWSRIRDAIIVRPRNETSAREKGPIGARVFADADGRFVAEHVSPGHYIITGYGTSARAFVEKPDSVVEVELKHPVETGMIAGAISGPIRPSDDFWGASVSVHAKDEFGYDFAAVQRAFEVEKTRVYHLEGLLPGTYGVLLSGAFSGIAPHLWVPDVEVKSGLLRQLDLEIPENRVVMVRVARDAVSGAATLETWRLQMPSGDWLPVHLFLGNQVAGRFALPLGRYAIEAEYADGQVVRQEVLVEPGEGEQEIVLKRR